MKVETKPLFPPVNHDYYKHILSPDIIWCWKDERYERECNVRLRFGECFKVYHKRCKLWHIEECWLVLKPQKISPNRYVKENFHVFCNVFRWAKHIRAEKHEAQRMGLS
jgi:hypothetical protein